ncbi:MAG: hypothetical protein EAZ60_02850 [Oscillatoriales cyanobacterium]|nr:MAG: hypothetical protein EAZ60_02850 [Oscillatoriales cyanobacterium]
MRENALTGEEFQVSANSVKPTFASLFSMTINLVVFQPYVTKLNTRIETLQHIFTFIFQMAPIGSSGPRGRGENGRGERGEFAR